MTVLQIERAARGGALCPHPDGIVLVPFPDLECVIQIFVKTLDQMLLIVHILDDGQRLQGREVHLHCEVGIAAAALQIEHVDLMALCVRGTVPARDKVGKRTHDPLVSGAGTGARGVDADRLRKRFPFGITVDDAHAFQLRPDLVQRFAGTVVLRPDDAVREVDHAAGRFMNTADVEHELAVHEDPHVIVAAVLEGDRLLDICAVVYRIGKFGFHRHAEVVIVAVAVIVRVFSRVVILIEREEADHEAGVFRCRILDRIAVRIKLDVVDVTFAVMVVIDDLECLVVDLEITCFLIVVGIIVVAVVEEVTGFFVSLEQVVDILVNGLVSALVKPQLRVVGVRREQIREAVIAGRVDDRIAVRAEIGSDDARNRSVAGVVMRFVVIARIAVLVRLITAVVVVDEIAVDAVHLHDRTVSAARDRCAVGQEQDVPQRVSAGVDAGVGDVLVRIRRTVRNPVAVVLHHSVDVVVVLRFQLAPAVIEQRELDALCDVVDRFDRVNRIAGRLLHGLRYDDRR